jgi:hypothetical protein
MEGNQNYKIWDKYFQIIERALKRYKVQTSPYNLLCKSKSNVHMHICASTEGNTTGKTGAAVLANSAVRPRTTEISLPCHRHTKHGNDTAHGKAAKEHTATRQARQRGIKAHGKETRHDNGRGERTAKI